MVQCRLVYTKTMFLIPAKTQPYSTVKTLVCNVYTPVNHTPLYVMPLSHRITNAGRQAATAPIATDRW